MEVTKEVVVVETAPLTCHELLVAGRKSAGIWHGDALLRTVSTPRNFELGHVRRPAGPDRGNPSSERRKVDVRAALSHNGNNDVKE